MSAINHALAQLRKSIVKGCLFHAEMQALRGFAVQGSKMGKKPLIPAGFV